MSQLKQLIISLNFPQSKEQLSVKKYREFAVKNEISKFFIFSQKKRFGEKFSKITIKLSKEFSSSRKPAKREIAAFTPYSRLLEIAKPLNYIIFKSLGKKRGQRKQLHLWRVSKASQLQYYLVKILQDNAFFYSVEKCQKSCLHHFSKFRKFSPSFTLGIIY